METEYFFPNKITILLIRTEARWNNSNKYIKPSAPLSLLCQYKMHLAVIPCFCFPSVLSALLFCQFLNLVMLTLFLVCLLWQQILELPLVLSKNGHYQIIMPNQTKSWKSPEQSRGVFHSCLHFGLAYQFPPWHGTRHHQCKRRERKECPY